MLEEQEVIYILYAKIFINKDGKQVVLYSFWPEM